MTSSALLIILPSLGLAMVILNALSMRTISQSSRTTLASATLLIPMRNEEKNVESAIISATSQRGIGDFAVRILNDHSEDATLSLLQKNRSNFNFEILHGKDLPDGWLGKNWACFQLSEGLESKYFVFVDADVELDKNALSNSIDALEKWELDFLSPHPREVALTFFERIIQPLLQWSWMASVPLRLAERFGIRSMTIANGQFFIISRDAYVKIGGHNSIRDEVLDDLALARELVRNGFRGAVADASPIAQCRMYSSRQELINGYTKSLWRAFGSPIGALLASLILLILGILPISYALLGNSWGFIAYLLVALSFAITAKKTRSSWAATFLHPLSIVILIGLIQYSFIKHNQGKNIWKGRSL